MFICTLARTYRVENADQGQVYATEPFTVFFCCSDPTKQLNNTQFLASEGFWQ